MKRTTHCMAGLALVLGVINANALTRWGLPSYTDISAYAVDDYRDISDLTRSVAHKDAFIGNLQSRLSSKYPTVSSTVRYNLSNSAATIAAYTSTNSDISEFVFSAGHGYYNGLWMWDGFIRADQKSFGGWTRWVIIDACLALNPALNQTAKTLGGLDYSWFNGAHAILGNHADGWQYIDSYNCFFSCSHHRSESQYEDFAANFISNGQTIWASYKNAVYHWIYQIGGLGVQPAVLNPMGYADNGQYVEFRNEYYQNTYNGPFGTNWGASSVNYELTYETYGTPSY